MYSCELVFFLFYCKNMYKGSFWPVDTGIVNTVDIVYRKKMYMHKYTNMLLFTNTFACTPAYICNTVKNNLKILKKKKLLDIWHSESPLKVTWRICLTTSSFVSPSSSVGEFCSLVTWSFWKVSSNYIGYVSNRSVSRRKHPNGSSKVLWVLLEIKFQLKGEA